MVPEQAIREAEVIRLGGDSLSRAEFVYATLRSAIHEGKLKPGDRLREVEIAEQLGVSRTPVREALKRLESNGLVTVLPQRGAVMTQLNQQQVIELYAFREELEAAAVRLATQHAAESEIRALRELVVRQAAITAEQPEAVAQIDRHFHETIYWAARNRYLLQAFVELGDALALLGGGAFTPLGYQTTALQQHQQIVDALERRDVAAAEEAIRLHIRTAQRLRLLLMFGVG